MNWIYTTLTWYFYLFLTGLIFFPLAKRIFGKIFIDGGYGFSKALALLFLSYSAFILGFLKILPFTRLSLAIILFLAALLNIYLFKTDQNKKEINWLVVVFEELLFFVSLFFWTFIRGQEPSVRGLEKFMDFGFINSILRANYFPPLDMWLSADSANPQGYSVNYYYFGHLTGAVLIKLSNIASNIGYNLLLSTIFALGVTQVFSLTANIAYLFLKKINKEVSQINHFFVYLTGIITAFIVNLAGNLHPIYLFTKGYPNENPVPFWQILSGFNPAKYWYPNATRFIPFTIHEFPSYSYVVADLHGHVFAIPFVLLTLAVFFKLYIGFNTQLDINDQKNKNDPPAGGLKLTIFAILTTNYSLLTIVFLGFLIAVHYMTNALDGPIYFLLILIILFLIYKLSIRFVVSCLMLIISFFIFTLPFSANFSPFVSGIGLNCSPEFLLKIGKLGPFLFEKGNCQGTPVWMLFVLWGFFWVNLGILLFIKKKHFIDRFFLLLFFYGTFLILVPIYFYFKDIYPAHFRANTMFKLGYQAFIMLGLASGYTFFRIKFIKGKIFLIGAKVIFFIIFGLIALYPFFSVPSYYGTLQKTPELDGAKWFADSYPEDLEIITYLNNNIKGQPVIIEAQGDSYTDYERISSYTGLPTVAGWQVHEWLWRGSADVVGKRIPDIVNFYESEDLNLTKDIIKKYQIEYAIVASLERQKYKNIKEDKFAKIGKILFRTSKNNGAIYQLNQ